MCVRGERVVVQHAVWPSAWQAGQPHSITALSNHTHTHMWGREWSYWYDTSQGMAWAHARHWLREKGWTTRRSSGSWNLLIIWADQNSLWNLKCRKAVKNFEAPFFASIYISATDLWIYPMTFHCSQIGGFSSLVFLPPKSKHPACWHNPGTGVSQQDSLLETQVWGNQKRICKHIIYLFTSGRTEPAYHS